MAPAVSVLQLDTNFPRVPGDVGCPETYCGCLETILVGNATVDKIVNDRPDLNDILPFELALNRATADVVVTSCGFLSYWQGHLAAQTSKPFISSSLIALEHLSVTHAPGEVLILTFDATSLTARHLGRYADFATGIVGLPNGMHLEQVISQDLRTIDAAQVNEELSDFVSGQLRPHHKHLLLECTNLPPYKAVLRNVAQLPVTDILTEIEAARPGTVQPMFL